MNVVKKLLFLKSEKSPQMSDDKYFLSADIEQFRFSEDRDISKEMIADYGFDGDLLDIMVNNKDNIVHKWHHYIPLYDHYFSKYRGTKVRFLEIGVSKGGSLQMWREYFGPEATIFGIDIDESCAKYNGQAAEVRIGSQDDPIFLREVVEEMGGVDVVLDDGSHMMPHIKTSMRVLFPELSSTGHYVVEDLHTAYMQHFGGGYDVEDNFFNMVRDVIDDMHTWYHKQPEKFPNFKKMVRSVHVHDSMVIFDKGLPVAPRHSEIA